MASFTLPDFGSMRDSFLATVKSIYEKIMNQFFPKPVSILFLGLDSAGKTTLVHKLKTNVNGRHLPTYNSSVEKVQIGNLNAVLVDIGGHDAARSIWGSYFFDVDGIIFIVDASETKRLPQVAEAWKTVMDSDCKAPVLVIMNKIDRLSHTPESIEHDLELKKSIEQYAGIRSEDGTRDNQRQIHIIYTSVINVDVFKPDTTLRNGFKWLSQNVSTKKQ